MNTGSRLDELFSLDRLRKNWQLSVVPTLEPTQNAAILDIHAKYQELQHLVGKRFHDVSRLSGRFDELTEIINQTFPLNAATDAVDFAQKEAIVGKLEQLEALLWAMDLSRRGER